MSKISAVTNSSKIRILDKLAETWIFNIGIWKDCLELGHCKFVQNVIELILSHLYQSRFLNFLNFMPNIFISKLDKDWNTNRFTLQFWFHYTSLKIPFRYLLPFFLSSRHHVRVRLFILVRRLPLSHLIVSKMNLGN